MKKPALTRPDMSKLYIAGVFAAGLTAVALSVLEWSYGQLGYRWLVLALLTLVSRSFSIRIPGAPATISVSDAFVFLLVLLYGPAPATLAAALSGLLISAYRRRREGRRVLFNFGEPAVSVWVASHVYYLVSGVAPLSVQWTELGGLLLPMLLFSLVYFVLSSGLNALAVTGETGVPLHRVWRGYFLGLCVNYFACASIAVLLAAASLGSEFLALSLVIPLLITSYVMVKTSMARFDDAKRHDAEVSQIQFLHDEERRNATEALRLSEERYRRLFEESRDALYATSADGSIVAVNDSLLTLFGVTREELVGSPAELGGTSVIEGWMPREQRDQFRSAMARAGKIHDFEVSFRRKDGAVIDCLVTSSAWRAADGTVEAYQGDVRDITQQKRLEQQLRQSQKMEAIGRLAGGVAHDFNNLLTVILGYAEALSARSIDAAMAEEVAEIKGAAERAALLTSQLLAFSRRQRLEPKVIDINWVVVNADRMLQRILGEDIRLNAVTAPGSLTVLADPGQLGQVLLNLAVNARDAMPKGGALTIETGSAEVGLGASEILTAGPHAMLSISDTGTGMDAETQSQIFEPFFSTKGTRGTGLGLATVYGIVRQSGGDIHVRSELGRGSTFTIYLPLAVGVPEYEASQVQPTLKGGEHILVVEDEPVVRRLIVNLLRQHGYQVSEAGDGQQALGMAARADVLLTDIVMPGLDGGTLRERVRAKRPDIKVVFMSGYADHALFGNRILNLDGPFVQKPFTPLALLTKLREAIDGASQASRNDGLMTRPRSG